MAVQRSFGTPVVRYYIDTRSFTQDPNPAHSQTVELPLIEKLPHDIQTKVRKFVRAPDRLMSLGSALLKFLFIHRTAKIPWSEIRISKTPNPHARPYWDPPRTWTGDEFGGVEFNVSHQAGVVALMGCRTPTRPKHFGVTHSTDKIPQLKDFATAEYRTDIRVGVDVACTREPRRTPDLSTQARLDEWVDTFSEMFSDRESHDMKHEAVPAGAGRIMEQKARRFYAYWALKEAYIKMVGEGLLADWLRELEFVNVLPPGNGERFRAQDVGMKVLFWGKDVTEAMVTELQGIGDDFLFVTMMRGVEEQAKDNREWKKLDIEQDIRACAEGTCQCLG